MTEIIGIIKRTKIKEMKEKQKYLKNTDMMPLESENKQKNIS